MKKDAIIIRHGSGKFFGFISDFPAICAQSETVDGVRNSLKECAKFYFDFMANSDIEIENQELINL